MVDAIRGRIQPPNLDNRTWQDLVDEARALIPKYAPQWTDTSASDLGVTLIELFAWLVEGLIYRLNRVPEKNYIAFLNLLDITREPAVPAHVFLTFTTQPPLPNQPAQPVRVPAFTRAQTQSSETEEPIIFETDQDASILPLNLKAVLLISNNPARGKPSYTNITTALATPPANGYTLPLPGAPAVPAGQPAQPAPPVQLVLGFDQSTALPFMLNVSFSHPIIFDASPTMNKAQATVAFTYSTANAGDPTMWPSVTPSATNTPPTVVDTTNGLQQDGNIVMTLPPPTPAPPPTGAPASWASQVPTSTNPQQTQWTTPPTTTADQISDALFWVGLTLTNQLPTPTATPTVTAAPTLQLGINYILFNAVSAHNVLSVPTTQPDVLGQSTGQPFQTLQLHHYPLFKRPDTDTPYDHLIVQVSNDQTWTQDNTTLWTPVDDLPLGPGNVYRFNPVTGEISFGNFDPSKNQVNGRGSIPPTGAYVKASYRYVANGLAGNVGAGKINGLVTPMQNIAGVINTISSFDAADEEPIEDTLRRAPELLRTRDRAITVEDYEVLAREATNDVFIVRCLDPRIQDATSVSPPPTQPGMPWRFGGIDRSPGNVNVIIVPDQGPNVPRPQPSNDLLRGVQAYLDERRDLTVRLAVTGPRYVPIKVSVNMVIWQNLDTPTLETTLRSDMSSKINAFLHPTRGGLNGTGWQVGQSVFVTDLFKAIMPSPDIGYISLISVKTNIPLYYSPTSTTDQGQRPLPIPKTFGSSVRLADYELVCSADQKDTNPDPLPQGIPPGTVHIITFTNEVS